MKEHQYALSLAARGKLPERIDGASRPSVSIIRELIDAGLIKAVNASSFDGEAYLRPQITLAGREYLAQLQQEKDEEKMKKDESKKGALDSANRLSTGRDAWLEIKQEFGVTKRTLARRISFVRNGFKRDVIFRDIEQASLLAEHGFYKPSVVLAGGVVEELLRLYLEHKNVAPESSSLDSYIRTCEENGFLKDAIHKLADSVRQFRNIVHLKREISRKYGISKATAKGAVSSVFTIANELGT